MNISSIFLLGPLMLSASFKCRAHHHCKAVNRFGPLCSAPAHPAGRMFCSCRTAWAIGGEPPQSFALPSMRGRGCQRFHHAPPALLAMGMGNRITPVKIFPSNDHT
eukprot:GHVT01042948.1.p2 GENE.GHVT01042948.1~~GHVT01042948.1.p2  ORF type:complete len:106 (-),score=12.41 GHVT01042948.1:496-813(-)